MVVPDRAQGLMMILNDQEDWMRSKIASNSSSLWKQMGNIVAQYDGMFCKCGNLTVTI